MRGREQPRPSSPWEVAEDSGESREPARGDGASTLSPADQTRRRLPQGAEAGAGLCPHLSCSRPQRASARLRPGSLSCVLSARGLSFSHPGVGQSLWATVGCRGHSLVLATAGPGQRALPDRCPHCPLKASPVHTPGGRLLRPGLWLPGPQSGLGLLNPPCFSCSAFPKLASSCCVRPGAAGSPQGSTALRRDPGVSTSLIASPRPGCHTACEETPLLRLFILRKEPHHLEKASGPGTSPHTRSRPQHPTRPASAPAWLQLTSAVLATRPSGTAGAPLLLRLRWEGR